jgi:hypothetical protein
MESGARIGIPRAESCAPQQTGEATTQALPGLAGRRRHRPSSYGICRVASRPSSYGICGTAACQCAWLDLSLCGPVAEDPPQGGSGPVSWGAVGPALAASPAATRHRPCRRARTAHRSAALASQDMARPAARWWSSPTSKIRHRRTFGRGSTLEGLAGLPIEGRPRARRSCFGPCLPAQGWRRRRRSHAPPASETRAGAPACHPSRARR